MGVGETGGWKEGECDENSAEERRARLSASIPVGIRISIEVNERIVNISYNIDASITG